MGELILAGESEFDGDAKSFDGHDRNGSHCRADGYVDKGVLFAVYGTDFVDHHGREYCDQQRVEQKSWHQYGE